VGIWVWPVLVVGAWIILALPIGLAVVRLLRVRRRTAVKLMTVLTAADLERADTERAATDDDRKSPSTAQVETVA
jgi:hypothetical protein